MTDADLSVTCGIAAVAVAQRIWIAVQALGLARACYAEALQWAKERETFGRPLITRQVIRHKLVDMFASIETTAALLASVVARVEVGEAPVPTICILKNQAVGCMQFCADEGLQILGEAVSCATWGECPLPFSRQPSLLCQQAGRDTCAAERANECA